MFSKLKRKLKKKLILNNSRHIKRFGLIGTKIESDGSDVFENCTFECNGENNVIKLCGGVNLTNSNIFISGSGNVISIGKGSYISGATFWIEQDGNSIIIGDHLSANSDDNFTCIGGHKLTIGKDCLFSTQINFQVGDGHTIFDAEGKIINETEDISIGDHVWIGKRATILKGVRIMNDCIVGAGAILTKQFDETNCIIAGVPAKIVKKGVGWKK